MSDHRTETRAGFVYAVGAYTIWGTFPLVFHAIQGVSNQQVLACRIVGAFAALAAAVSILARWKTTWNAVIQWRLLGALVISSILILINWLIFMIAARSGHVLAASLGYFINPLVNVVLGLLFLGERLRRLQIAAILLAATGVVALAIEGGNSLWIGLTLAFSFGLYGLIRKVIAVDALEGLFVETTLLAPFAAAYLAFAAPGPAAAYSTNIGYLFLLGPLTALPLLLFAAAARRLAYGTLGLIQYVGPSIQFVIALWLGERFGLVHAITFGCVWAALLLYVAEMAWHQQRQAVEPEPPC